MKEPVALILIVLSLTALGIVGAFEINYYINESYTSPNPEQSGLKTVARSFILSIFAAISILFFILSMLYLVIKKQKVILVAIIIQFVTIAYSVFIISA